MVTCDGIGVFIRRGRGQSSFSKLHKERHSRKKVIYKPGREPSPGTDPAGTLISDLWPPGL